MVVSSVARRPLKGRRCAEFEAPQGLRMDEGVHQRAPARLAAAGPSTGRDRVFVQRPRDRSRSPERYLIEGEATPFTLHTVLAARGDARPPRSGVWHLIPLC